MTTNKPFEISEPVFEDTPSSNNHSTVVGSALCLAVHCGHHRVCPAYLMS